ncbi:hypothetical protein ALP00_200094 [Pseudomonas coronafaciens pv. porri]|nr:hypothetical protein ALP00_200094 [Pseudomonas coronafaciens pv. porri]
MAVTNRNNFTRGIEHCYTALFQLANIFFLEYQIPAIDRGMIA